MARREFLLIANVLNAAWTHERDEAEAALRAASVAPAEGDKIKWRQSHRWRTDRIAMVARLADDFAVALRGTNPRFDEQRFLAHCFRL